MDAVDAVRELFVVAEYSVYHPILAVVAYVEELLIVVTSARHNDLNAEYNSIWRDTRILVYSYQPQRHRLSHRYIRHSLLQVGTTTAHGRTVVHDGL